MKWVRGQVLSGRIFGGAWLSLGSPVTAEITGRAGFDWVLLDMEHGCGNYSDLLHQMQALSASTCGPIVRVPAMEASVFKHVLDMGPSGLMIPNVSTAEMARHAVSISRIPPLGVRGSAQTTRASGYGFGYDEYVRDANDGLLIVAQIESREGVTNAEEIAAVDGIDVLFVGPLDLSIDLGDGPGGIHFNTAVKHVADAAAKHGKIAGVLVRNQEQALDYVKQGYSFIALGSDRGQVINGMKHNAAFFAQLRNDAHAVS
ncbi:MAG: aldolase/citrate lyase family protein [Pusillimonas sp.]